MRYYNDDCVGFINSIYDFKFQHTNIEKMKNTKTYIITKTGTRKRIMAGLVLSSMIALDHVALLKILPTTLVTKNIRVEESVKKFDGNEVEELPITSEILESSKQEETEEEKNPVFKFINTTYTEYLEKLYKDKIGAILDTSTNYSAEVVVYSEWKKTPLYFLTGEYQRNIEYYDISGEYVEDSEENILTILAKEVSNSKPTKKETEKSTSNLKESSEQITYSLDTKKEVLESIDIDLSNNKNILNFLYTSMLVEFTLLGTTLMCLINNIYTTHTRKEIEKSYILLKEQIRLFDNFKISLTKEERIEYSEEIKECNKIKLWLFFNKHNIENIIGKKETINSSYSKSLK